MGIGNFYIENGSAESASPESICFDVKSRVIFSSGCFVVKAYGSISTSWHTSSRSVAKVSGISLCLR